MAKDSNKKLVQQAFHPGLFIARPRSASLTSTADANFQSQAPPTPYSLDTESENRNPPTWQRIPLLRNAKKRKKDSSPSPEKIMVANRFSTLPVDLEENIEKEAATKIAKRPPIILYGIEDLTKLTELLESVANETDFIYRIINQNQHRINSINLDAYKSILQVIRD